jgi:hypothetical protein
MIVCCWAYSKQRGYSFSRGVVIFLFTIKKKLSFPYRKRRSMKKASSSSSVSQDDSSKKFFKLMGNAILLASIQASIGSVDIPALVLPKAMQVI